MKTIELCMKYDTCLRCPLNKRCEAEFKREQERKEKPKVKNNVKNL